ncbi:hypothetical protein EYD10_03434 [Varanus komodoensis]|nr:hypothetical protein EYD10_03434 [Varanus komodoensis]
MICPFWVALHGIAHSFIELRKPLRHDKAVIHEGGFAVDSMILHWLPIEVRAQFKVLVMTYKALNGLGPGYLKERLRPYMPGRPLRSVGEALLREPSVKEIRRTYETMASLCVVVPYGFPYTSVPSLSTLKKKTLN